MYGDPDAIRALARTLHDQGEEVREEGRRLVALVAATRWTGLAAEAADALARRRADDLLACAARHDDAAEGLARHAAEVERRLELLARAERVLGGLVAGGATLARELVPDLVSDLLPDPRAGAWPDLDLRALTAAATRRLAS